MTTLLAAGALSQHPPPLFQLIAYQCPDILLFLLPSDIATLAATSADFFRYFSGCSSHESTNSSLDDILEGELWWRQRCLDCLALSVVGVVHPCYCQTWMSTYCFFRNQFRCKVSVRFTRDVSDHSLKYFYDAPPPTNGTSKDSTNHSRFPEDTFNEWVPLNDEELEEISLERFFQQSDFYKHQLTTVFVINVKVIYQLNNNNNDHYQRRDHQYKYYQDGQLTAFARQSFVNATNETTSRIIRHFDDQRPYYSIRMGRESSHEHCSSTFQRPHNTNTEIVAFDPDPQILPLPSNFFFQTRQHPNCHHHGPQEEDSSSSSPSDDRSSSNSSTPQNNKRLQSRLLLPSRARLVQFHHYIVEYIAKHELTRNYSIGPHKVISPTQLMFLCYKLTTSFNFYEKKYSIRYSKSLFRSNSENLKRIKKPSKKETIDFFSYSELPTDLKKCLDPQVWVKFVFVFLQGAEEFYKKNPTSLGGQQQHQCGAIDSTATATALRPPDQPNNNNIPTTEISSSLERLQNLLTRSTVEHEHQNPGWRVTRFVLTVTSNFPTQRSAAPSSSSTTTTNNNNNEPILQLPAAYTQEVFHLNIFPYHKKPH